MVDDMDVSVGMATYRMGCVSSVYIKKYIFTVDNGKC